MDLLSEELLVSDDTTELSEWETWDYRVAVNVLVLMHRGAIIKLVKRVLCIGLV